MLERVFDFQKEIQFAWTQRSAMDIQDGVFTRHNIAFDLNDLNKKLLGSNQQANNLYQHAQAFEKLLEFWKCQLEKGN